MIRKPIGAIALGLFAATTIVLTGTATATAKPSQRASDCAEDQYFDAQKKVCRDKGNEGDPGSETRPCRDGLVVKMGRCEREAEDD